MANKADITTTVEVEVIVSPGLKSPLDITPYLRDAMYPATREVQASAEQAIGQLFKRRNNWSRRHNRQGYGPLHGSLSSRSWSEKGDGAAGFVRTFAFYARFLEKGAGAHPVVAKNARALPIPTTISAFARVGGARPGLLFRKRARHPGIRARFWMRSAANANVSDVVGHIERAASQWAVDAERGLGEGMPT